MTKFALNSQMNRQYAVFSSWAAVYFFTVIIVLSMFLSLTVKELSCSSHRKSFFTRIVRLMNHLNELLAVPNMNCQPKINVYYFSLNETAQQSTIFSCAMLRHLFAKLLTSLSFLELKQDCTYLMRQYPKQTSSVVEGTPTQGMRSFQGIVA